MVILPLFTLNKIQKINNSSNPSQPFLFSGKRPYKGPDMVPEGSPTLVEYGQRIGWSKAQYSSIYEIAKELSEIEAVEPPQPPEMFVPLR